MTTRRNAMLAIAALTSFKMAARAQSVKARPRLAYLHPASAETSAVYKSLVSGLAALGYVDGSNIALQIRSGNGRPEAIPALVSELVREQPDVLLVVGPATVRAAIGATGSIPIVAIDLESDPVHNGWIKSLARPGGNVTGFFLDLTAMAAKWLQLLREAAPGSHRIGMLWDASTGDAQVTATRAVAKTLGLDVDTVRVTQWDAIDAVLASTFKSGTQAVVVLSSPTAFQYSARIAEVTGKMRLPAISPFRPFPLAGGLMSYGPDLELFFARVAPTIDRILKGAAAADVAVEQPTKYEFVINAGTAKALGLTLPASLMLRADEVIQ